jgi:hypothetical protein
VMMLAEKAADLIAGNAPLEPQTTPFYRRPRPARAGRGGRQRAKVSSSAGPAAPVAAESRTG